MSHLCLARIRAYTLLALALLACAAPRAGAQCNADGFVSLDRAVYACDDTVTITVSDCGENTTAEVDTVDALVIINGNTPVSLEISETGPDTGIFEVQYVLASSETAPIEDGDGIIVLYAQGPAGGEMAEAVIDCETVYLIAPPRVTVTKTRAFITFNTNVPANARVAYGTNCSATDTTVSSDQGVSTSHSVMLDMLAPNALYFFDVFLKAPTEIEYVDDDPLSCHNFSTLETIRPPFFDDFEHTTLGDWTINAGAVGDSPFVGLDNTIRNHVPTSGTRAVSMGRTGSGGLTEATLDLTLNLEGVLDPVLSFNWLTVGLESGNFVRLEIFDGTWHGTEGGFRTPSSGWTENVVPLGSYNMINGFIIRFRAVVDFGESSDAVYIDDVRVANGVFAIDEEEEFSSIYTQGRAATPPSKIYTVRNSGNGPITVTAVPSVAWLAVEPVTTGEIPGGGTATMEVRVETTAASALDVGEYSGEIAFSISGDTFSVKRSATLEVVPQLSLSPASKLRLFGEVGGPFTPTWNTCTITGADFLPAESRAWSATTDVPWLEVFPASGTVDESAPTDDCHIRVRADLAPTTPGLYNALVTFTVDELGAAFATREVELEIGAAAPPRAFAWYPLNNDPGWPRDGAWEFGPPFNAAGDPAIPHTGSFLLGYNIGANYTSSMSARYLTAGPFDCSNYENIELNFWRWLQVASYSTDRAIIQMSKDGLNWSLIWQNPYGTLLDTTWQNIAHDISDFADREPAVYIRWQMGPTNSSTNYGGWNLDDIALLGDRIDAVQVPNAGPLSVPLCDGYVDAPACIEYTVLNVSDEAVTVSLVSEVSWLEPSSASIVVEPLGGTVTQVCYVRGQMPETTGSHSGVIQFVNGTTGSSQPAEVLLEIEGFISPIDTPTPADGAGDQPIYTQLAWSGGENALAEERYTVSLGTAPDELQPICSDQPGTTCDPGQLRGDTIYYWQLSSTNRCGTVAGPVWRFDTRACVPNAPVGVFPLEGAVNQKINMTLEWGETSPPLKSTKGGAGNAAYPPHRHVDAYLGEKGGNKDVVDPGITRVLIATAYADKNPTGEVENTLASIDLHTTAYSATTTDTTDPAELATLLANADLLIVAEQESLYSEDIGELGASWRDVLQEFVSNGGTVVVCGFQPYSGVQNFMWAAGLMEFFEQVRRTTSRSYTVDTAQVLANGMPSTFQAPVISVGVDLQDGTPIITDSSGFVYAASREIGRGLALYVGTDFSYVYPEFGQLVANAIFSARKTTCPSTFDVSIGTSPFLQTLICEDTLLPRCETLLEPDTTYYWTVAETNCCGTSIAAQYSFTTGSCDVPVEPASPSPVDEAVEVPTSYYFRWEDQPFIGCDSSYDVLLGTSPGALGLACDNLSASVCMYSTRNLQPDTTYYWQVQTKNLAGTESSPVWSFSTRQDDAALCGNEDVSFEGNNSAWSIGYSGGSAVYGWQVGSANTGWFGNGQPYDGTKYLQNMFDGEAGSTYTLHQEVAIPADATTLRVDWAERVQWDLVSFCDGCTQPREYHVELQPAGGGAPIATLHSATFAAQTTGDTGYDTHSIDLTPQLNTLAGTTVRLVFRQIVPETYTGPAQFDIDNVCVAIEVPEPEPEGEGEGGVEGEGEGEGEGNEEGEGAIVGVQSADQDGNFVISLSELLRVVQFYNSLGLHCAAVPSETEDGYVPGPGVNKSCAPHSTDYNPQDWAITLTELLRLVQLYNALGYSYCPDSGSEDGFCVGPAV